MPHEWIMKDISSYYMHGLPDGLNLRKLYDYGTNQLRRIVSCEKDVAVASVMG